MEIGGGSWRDYVKLWGEIVAKVPLKSDHCNEPCVHYVSTVIREYEDTERVKTNDGRLKTIRKRKSETVASTQRSIPFWLRDRTGQVKVHPDGADIEMLPIMDELRPAKTGDTLGYRYRESILPVAQSVLVVGAVSDLTGEVIIRKPVKSSNRFLISLQDEDELTGATLKRIQLSFWLMIACWSTGIVLLIAGTVS